MNKGLNGIKNIVWALCVFAALIALLVGLIFAMSGKFHGEKPDGILHLDGSGYQKPVKQLSQGQTDGGSGELNSTQDRGLEYVLAMTYLCDGSLSGIKDFAEAAGVDREVEVWTHTGSGMPAASAADQVIILPSDQSVIKPGSAAMVRRPARLVIYLGADELADATKENFVAGYSSLLRSIKEASPDTKVLCCTLGSISASYMSTDNLTPELIVQANEWIREVCSANGCYLADIASVLNGEDGYIQREYVNSNGRTLSDKGISAMMDYLRYHAI